MSALLTQVDVLIDDDPDGEDPMLRVIVTEEGPLLPEPRGLMATVLIEGDMTKNWETSLLTTLGRAIWRIEEKFSVKVESPSLDDTEMKMLKAQYEGGTV